jgi:hypothetical protein
MSKENEVKTPIEQVDSQAGQLSESQLEAVAGGIIIINGITDDDRGIIITGGKGIIDTGKEDLAGNVMVEPTTSR